MAAQYRPCCLVLFVALQRQDDQGEFTAPKAKRVRRIYKTAADVMKDASAGPGMGPIIDMRGKSVKVLSSFEEGLGDDNDEMDGSDEENGKGALV